MKSSVFYTFVLLIFTAILNVYYVMRHHFVGLDDLVYEKKQLIQQVQTERLKLEISEYKFKSFQQEVASLAPQWSKGLPDSKKSYQLRSLASVNQKLELDHWQDWTGRSVFIKARDHFRNGNYESAVKGFKVILDKYSFSVHVIEAQFLLAESYFQLRELEKSLTAIDSLVTQYPGHDLTGYSLLRLGQIFEYQDRLEEAEGVYKTVQQSFSNRDIQKQAQVALKAMRL